MTVYDNPVLDGAGTPFPAGVSTDNEGNTRACVTFILLLPPKTILHAATLTARVVRRVQRGGGTLYYPFTRPPG